MTTEGTPRPDRGTAAPRLEPADVREAARALRAVLAAVERDELAGGPLMLARLTGALAALDALDGGPTEPLS